MCELGSGSGEMAALPHPSPLSHSDLQYTLLQHMSEKFPFYNECLWKIEGWVWWVRWHVVFNLLYLHQIPKPRPGAFLVHTKIVVVEYFYWNDSGCSPNIYTSFHALKSAMKNLWIGDVPKLHKSLSFLISKPTFWKRTLIFNENLWSIVYTCQKF